LPRSSPLSLLDALPLSLAALRADDGSGPGYDPLLRRRLLPLLGPLAHHGTKLVTNAGAADPLGAAQMARELARASSRAICAAPRDRKSTRLNSSHVSTS